MNKDKGSTNGKVRVYVNPEVKKLIPKYLSNRKKDVKALRGAVVREDFDWIRNAADMIQEHAAAYGFERLVAIGRQLEIEARRKHKENISRCIEEMKNFLDRVEVV